MSRWVPWLFVLVAVSAFGLWERWVHDPYVRQVATLERSRDSLDRAVLELKADSVRRVGEDKIVRDSIGVLLRHVSTSPHLDSAIHQGFVADTVFVRELPDSLKPKAWALVARKDTIIAELLSDRSNLLGVVALMQRQIVRRDSALVHTRLALLEALKQRDGWRKVARPSLPKRILREVPKLAAVGLIGWLLH